MFKRKDCRKKFMMIVHHKFECKYTESVFTIQRFRSN